MLKNKMLQFLNSDIEQFTQQEKQDQQERQDENCESDIPQIADNSQRQIRVKSFEEKPQNKPLNLIFQMLLQKKTQKRQQIKIDPKSIPLQINLTIQVQELSIIKKIMEKNEWKKANNFDGDILWCGPDNIQQAKQFTYDFAMVFINQCISRIPGAKLIATKKETTQIMSKMRDYFPSVYNFYPKTYTLPEDFTQFIDDFDKNQGISYIAKPDKGTQGQGIFIVSQIEDLFTNGIKDMQYLKKNYIIQEYINNPLLLDDKKFDFRLYVLITSVKPLIAYINEEGLARLCTENYEQLDQNNLQNIYMHLTNYSLNKNSQNFIQPPHGDFQKINFASKRTYTSAKKTFMKMGIDVPKLKLRIEQTIVRFLYGIAPFLLNSTREIYQDKWERANCFHVIGFDILVDKDLKPWIIEINANPSLEISQVSYDKNGIKKIETSCLDLYVKSKVLEDAFIIAIKSPQEQIEHIGKGKYCNSYKMIADGQPPIENLDLFYKLVELYSNLCGLRYGNLNQMRFCRLANYPSLVNDHLLKSDYDLIYKKIQLKSLQSDLNFWSFIDAIEQVAEKLLKRKTSNYSIQKAISYIVNSTKRQQQLQRPLTAKR